MNAVYKYTFCVYFSYVSRYLTYPANNEFLLRCESIDF